MTESKKVWVEPELIVLVRHQPEEAVLTACKQEYVGVGGSGDAVDCCRVDYFCGICTTHSAS